MEPRDLVVLVGFAGFGTVVYLGFAVLALKTRKPAYRVMGRKILVLFGVMMAMYGVVVMVRSAGPPDFETVTPGPPQGMATILRQVEFPVTDVDATQVVELTPMALQVAMGMVRIAYRVEDGEGKVLNQGMQVAAGQEGRSYQTLRFSFEGVRAGAHRLFVEIPEGVDQARVVVKEVQ